MMSKSWQGEYISGIGCNEVCARPPIAGLFVSWYTETLHSRLRHFCGTCRGLYGYTRKRDTNDLNSDVCKDFLPRTSERDKNL